jgi:molybdate transport system substrate-binding protein
MSIRRLLLLSCLLFACGPKREAAPETVAPAAPEPAPVSSPLAPKAEDQLVVFAAASLRDAFTTLGDTFRTAHSGVAVTFNFAGTQELRTQLEQGAQVDVFASADQKHMNALKAAGRVTDPIPFARNEPVIVATRESAKKVRGLADLQKLQKLVIGAPEVPIGRYTLQIFDRASAKLGPKFSEKTLAKVASRELNVRQVLAKVGLGEADAGIVYRTDAQSLKEGKDRITVVDITPEFNVIAEYPIAVVADAPHPTLARAWLELVQSDVGQQALQSAGFMPAHDTAASASSRSEKSENEPPTPT